jgi:hypothetical protein
LAIKPYLSQRQLRGLGIPDVAPPPARPAPVLNPWTGEPPPFGDRVGEGITHGCDANRVQLAGGFLNTLMVHPEVTPFEQLYRRQPEEGMFSDDVSPERPFSFELGAFRVPDTFVCLLFDLRPDIYRFSGVDAGDTVPVEARRFSSVLGFLPTIDGHQLANLLYQLDPLPIQTFQEAFTQPIGSVSEVPPALAQALGATNGARFNLSAATAFAAAAGAGDQLQPQRPVRYGALNVPFTLYVRPGSTFQVRCVLFNPLPSPIAFIEYDVAGMLIPELWVNTMTECMKPLSNASKGPGSLGGGPR